MTPVARYENRYKITEDGRILNLANNRFLTPIPQTNGYLKVALASGSGNPQQLLLHRLVALHFLPNPYEYPQVNHKDGDKENNHVRNLEWCSAQQNNEHALKTGLRPGYMSADDKELYLKEILSGVQVSDLAARIDRRAETLHKMLRDTAKRLGIHDQWEEIMRRNRRDAAIRNLTKINP